MVWAHEIEPVGTLIEEQRRALKGRSAATFDEEIAAAETWLSLMLPLGLVHETAGQEERNAIHEHLDETAKAIGSFAGGIAAFASRLELRLGETILVCEEWEGACERRSALQFADELLEGPDTAITEWADFNALGEALRWRGERDGCLLPEEVPKGVPSTHWWWWLPGEPPD